MTHSANATLISHPPSRMAKNDTFPARRPRSPRGRRPEGLDLVAAPTIPLNALTAAQRRVARGVGRVLAAVREQKPGRIQEVLDLHPRLRFVLIGDSGEKDPEIYAAVARANPGRIIAIYIREVRLDPGDGRVEEVSGTWTEDVPFVLAADTDAVRRHAVGLGLL